ncbi:MAG: respiratory nitrate reductase subunit gamma, partial [Ignavibacteriaceae bacterium]
WYFSFPFHLGLYLITGAFILIILSVILNLFSVINLSNLNSSADYFFHYLTILFGYAGLILTFIGSIGLIIQRATDKKFKFYNTPMDFINLFFILVLVISISITIVFSSSSFILSKEFVKNLIIFNWVDIPDILFILNVILISLFLLYFPITRMMHLFAKYFTYHDVRWEDEQNVKGSKLEKKVKEALNFGVSWSAPHMKTGKTWAEVATTFPQKEKK